jgi:hypothetical protein
MKVRQLSVFIENRAGRITEAADLLAKAGLQIRGFAVADTAEFGILRLIVDDPDRAVAVLREDGFTVRETVVLCVELPDRPGGLAEVLHVVSDAGVNIEYVYSLISTYIALTVADPDRALELLEGQPVRLVSQEELASV